MKKLRLPFFVCVMCFGAVSWGQARISILGDSYSTFRGYVEPDTNACWYPDAKGLNDVVEVEETWWYRLVHGHGYRLERNNSFSGATVCNTGYRKEDYSDRSFITRMDNLGNPDIILVFGGTNDSWAGVPIGEFQYGNWTKEDLYDFRPAFCYLLDYLTGHYPDAEVYHITNTDLSEDVTGSIDEICRHYNVANIVLHDIDKQREHPSVQGMKSISEQVWDFLSAKQR